MRKIICFILLTIIGSNFMFCLDVLPNIKTKDNVPIYLDMPIVEVERVLGKPEKITEELFTTEKPEYDEIFWEYDSGITVSFFRGSKMVRRIFIYSDNFLLEHDGIILNVGKTTLQDVVDIWGKGYERNLDNVLVAEYSFSKLPPESFYSHNLIAFYFINNLCNEIHIFDSSEFL